MDWILSSKRQATLRFVHYRRFCHHHNYQVFSFTAVTAKTAILIFSRTACLEAKSKPLIGHYSNDVALHTSLKKRITEVAKRSKLPVFTFTEREQEGSDFGERLYNAFQSLFNQGYEKVISVGSDIPELNVTDIKMANRELEHMKVVLGPDKRGGAYLIGLHKDALHTSFKNLRWQSAFLANDLRKYTELLKLSIHLLIARFDLNKIAEVGYLKSVSKVLALILEQLLKRSGIVWDSLESYVNLFTTREVSRRGPPVFSYS